MKLNHMLLIALAASVGLVLLAVLAGLIGGAVALLLATVFGIDVESNWYVLFLIYLVWSFLPSRYKVLNRDYEIRGEALVDAPASQVWDKIMPEPGKAHLQRTIVNVTAVEGRSDRLDFHSDPKVSDTPLPPLQAVLEEVDPNAYLRMTYLNVDQYPLWAGDLVSSEYYLEPVDGQTRITMIEKLNKLRVSTVLSLLLLNPCRDSMRRVKALCEGTPDTSWLSWLNDALDQDGNTTATVKSNINFIGISICVIVTLFVFGLIFGLFALIPK